jgi:hypothetical protein
LKNYGAFSFPKLAENTASYDSLPVLLNTPTFHAGFQNVTHSACVARPSVSQYRLPCAR